jgi:hypothetical protein
LRFFNKRLPKSCAAILKELFDSERASIVTMTREGFLKDSTFRINREQMPLLCFKPEPTKPPVLPIVDVLPGYMDENEYQNLTVPQKKFSRKMKSQNLSAAVVLRSTMKGVAL